MSMLAEPRRKQKWTLNPRGKQWSQDSNKFGQKMLEKMGWTSGKGLGANEQGITEHVKVSHKNNQSGIGFKDRGDQWTQHQADFNDFLSQLQAQNLNSDAAREKERREQEESLEEKSKQSQARVHYHKFTRAKDVKKYSSKDLANIFGKRDLKDAGKAPKVDETVEEITAEPVGSKDTRGGVLTVNSGNMDDYFKRKLPNLVDKSISNGADDSECEYQPRSGFGFGSIQDSCESKTHGKNSKRTKSAKRKEDAEPKSSGFAFANEGLDLEYTEKDRDSRRNNVSFAYDNPCLNLEKCKNIIKESTISFTNNGFVNPAPDLDNLTSDDNNGIDFEVSRVAFGLDNNALDLSDENNAKRRVTFNDKLEYSTDVIKKKKKRKGKDKLDKFEVDNSKLKRKAKEISSAINLVSEVEGFVNEALEIEGVSDEMNDNELNELKTKKSKRKKNRRLSRLETIEEIAEENSQINESEVGEAVLLDEVSPKKSKKLKKHPEIGANSESKPDISSEIQVGVPETKKNKEEKTIILCEESVSEKKSDRRKGKPQKVAEAEITVLAEISRKISKSTKNKVGDEPKSSDSRQGALESIEGEKKNKRRSKSKEEDKYHINTVETEEAYNRVDITKSSNGTKRKSSGRETCVKSRKRSKLDNRVAAEDTENVQQNTDISINSIPPTPSHGKEKRSKKTLKSFFAKAPILYFTGSNINEMPGYGASLADVKQD